MTRRSSPSAGTHCCPFDDCLYALQATIPHLTRSSLHRCLQRPRQPFKAFPIGYFHIDIVEVRTEEGKLYLFVGVDRTSKYAFAQLMKTATNPASAFLNELVAAVSNKSTPYSQIMAPASLTCPRTGVGQPPVGATTPSIAEIWASGTGS